MVEYCGIMGWMNVIALKHRLTHYIEQRQWKRQTEGDLKTKKRRLGELTQSLLTGEPRPRTVSKPSWSLQGSCDPLVHHNYWHTACQLRKETLSGASTETLLPADGQEEAGNATLCSELQHWQQWCVTQKKHSFMIEPILWLVFAFICGKKWLFMHICMPCGKIAPCQYLLLMKIYGATYKKQQ